MISTADLQDWMKAYDADAPVLRQLEESAVRTIQKNSGCYFGVSTTLIETTRFRGFPIILANEPTDGVLTSLEQWDGSAWTAVDAANYYVIGRLVYGEGSLSGAMPSRVRTTYPAGYTVDPTDDDVWAAPADVQQAVKMLVAHWFENREAAVTGTIQTETEFAIKMLLSPYTGVAV